MSGPPRPRSAGIARRAGSLVDRAAASYADELSRRWQGGLPRPLVPTAPLPSAAGAAPRERRLALVCHAFYPDVLDEVRDVALRLPPSTDLFFSVVDESARRAVQDRFADWDSGRVIVRIVENRGRDIAPKYVAFADVLQGGHELVLYLHTKKSTNEVVGPQWRRFLFDSLAGSRERVAGVLELFDRDPTLGVVAPEHYRPIVPWTGWDGNHPLTRRLARRMGLHVSTWSPPDFPSGSMFWARPAALAPIARLRLHLEDFPPEAAQIQRTVMHALERLVYVGAAAEGYRSVVIGPAQSPDTACTSPSESARSPRGRPGFRVRAASIGVVALDLVRSSAATALSRIPGRRTRSGV